MGDYGHQQVKKVPDALRYSPPQLSKYKAAQEHSEYQRSRHPSDQDQHKNNSHHPTNGHSQPPYANHRHNDGSPLHPVAPQHPVTHKRDIPPWDDDLRLPLSPKNGPNHHNPNPVRRSPPPHSEWNQHKNNPTQHIRAYDDYELDRRKQQMDRQAWPPRNPKDYMIGGIYGPQPKNKLPTNNNGHHPEPLHPPGTKLPPNNMASRALARQQLRDGAKQPYRSRSFPREEQRRVNNVGRNHGSHSLMDLKGPSQPTRNRNPVGAHREQGNNYLIREGDDDFVVDPRKDNGHRYGKPKRPTRLRAFERPIDRSDGTNNDAGKARMLMFYKNGDPFFGGVKISLRLGRDFASFDAFCSHLTQRIDLPHGVRYIFNEEGEKLTALEDFEDGGQYICSSRKKFVPLPYGPGQQGWKPHSKNANMEEHLKLIRPPSPTGPAGNSSDGQQGSRGRKFIRIINNNKQNLQIRHMLNSRTTQPWENMIEGMADALRMPHGRKLFSLTGRHIQSYSQLRNELKDGDIFYLCSADSFGPNLPRHSETSWSLDEASMARGRGQAQDQRNTHRPGSAPDGQPRRH